MRIRSSRISDSILAAVSAPDDQDAPGKDNKSIFQRALRIALAFFSLFRLLLTRYHSADFLDLRHNAWQLDEDEYGGSFRPAAEAGGVGAARCSSGGSLGRRKKGKTKDRAQLIPVGDLGYSGSTFFTTPDSKYLIKSLPRRFEHQFFTHDLLGPYLSHMHRRPHSLLVRITDMVYTPYPTLGGILGTAPTHHIIMENLMFGKQAAGERSGWETYDLKPNDYFFPERDLAGGRLTPASVKEKLIDEFPDKVRVTAREKRELLEILEADTQLLADSNAIDYSLFLVRYPGPNAEEDDDDDPRCTRALGDVPAVGSNAHPFRAGLVDLKGRWVYRMVVLDFFWARHKSRARILTGLVKAFNKVAHKGPMSITADPAEYRERFLRMVKEVVVGGEVHDGGSR